MTTVPPSPLAMMDAVEVFSWMGVDDPSAEEPPVKQVDAIDHVITARLPPTPLMGSRNINKLRVFAQGRKVLDHLFPNQLLCPMCCAPAPSEFREVLEIHAFLHKS
ncbi:hypothetical protein B0H14DRAFT_3437127 [Mycena olivaceomarginata]|nr:hypothetical protein B0H14DRAFT_3437127 [Mycena olivaceomarginata]